MAKEASVWRRQTTTNKLSNTKLQFLKRCTTTWDNWNRRFRSRIYLLPDREDSASKSVALGGSPRRLIYHGPFGRRQMPGDDQIEPVAGDGLAQIVHQLFGAQRFLAQLHVISPTASLINSHLTWCASRPQHGDYFPSPHLSHHLPHLGTPDVARAVSKLKPWLQQRFDYDTTTTYRARLLPFDARKINMSVFWSNSRDVVVS